MEKLKGVNKVFAQIIFVNSWRKLKAEKLKIKLWLTKIINVKKVQTTNNQKINNILKQQKKTQTCFKRFDRHNNSSKTKTQC